jgi:predicted CDP-diglyceride synthetase/phosphatidate cytidylyltransferase
MVAFGFTVGWGLRFSAPLSAMMSPFSLNSFFSNLASTRSARSLTFLLLMTSATLAAALLSLDFFELFAIRSDLWSYFGIVLNFVSG